MSIKFRDGMTVVEVEYPGTWIDGLDSERRFEFEHQFRSLQNPLTETSVALDGFRDASEALVIVERAAWLTQRHHSSCAFYARGFLYTFDRAGKLLVSLTQIDGVPSGGGGEHVEAFDREFPDLRDVRNSSAHYEERMQGRNQRGGASAIECCGNQRKSLFESGL